jgi:hypothetical protein
VALTPQQIASFRQLTGLAVLEPGRFWFDATTGAMGKEGSRWPQYQLYAQRSAPLAVAGVSLSERRMLFNSADLTGIWRVGSD